MRAVKSADTLGRDVLGEDSLLFYSFRARHLPVSTRYESGGQEFESLRARQQNQELLAKRSGQTMGRNFASQRAPRHQQAQPENAPAAISEQWGLSTRDPGSRLGAGSERGLGARIMSSS
jgi:hypothetical protein